MDAERFTVLKAELDRQLSVFSSRRRRDKRKAVALKMSTVALSGAITVLLGLQVASGSRVILANVALALGALSTVLAAYEGFYNHRGLWVQRSMTVDRLLELRRSIEFSAACGEPEEKELRSFFDRLNEIIRDDRESWLRLRSTEGGSGRAAARS